LSHDKSDASSLSIVFLHGLVVVVVVIAVCMYMSVVANNWGNGGGKRGKAGTLSEKSGATLAAWGSFEKPQVNGHVGLNYFHLRKLASKLKNMPTIKVTNFAKF